LKLGILLSATLGFAISTGSPFGLSISILAPVVFLRQSSRRSTYVCSVAYYLAALRDLVVVSRNFFGPTSGLAEGFLLWIIAAGLLSLPWFWAWSKSEMAALWRSPIALLLTVGPPLGLIGWASPLAAAGLLFPTQGFVGLGLTLLLPGLLTIGTAEINLGCLILLLCAHIGAPQPPRAPATWEAVSTHFGDVGHSRADLLREYQIGRELQRLVERSDAQVIIFPEAVAANWTAELFRERGKIIVLGATVPASEAPDLSATIAALQCSPIRQSTAAAAASYKNELLIRGAATGNFSQRVPVPLGMWKPFTNTGVPLNLFGPGIITITGERVAPLICYEQLIAWPVLTSFLQQPSIMVAVSNNVWVSGTAIVEVEATSMKSWAALFNVPIIFASNT
jgi:hypothetical protein